MVKLPSSAGWLLISYHAPREPSALRVLIWRALTQAGAVALGGGVYALPNTPEFAEKIVRLGERIVEGGGTALKFQAAAMTQADDESMRRMFEAARTDEYIQVARSAGRLIEHIKRELEHEDFRLAELETLEEELEKVRRQHRRVVERDWLGTPAKEEADSAILEAEKALQEYLEKACEYENRG